MRRFPAWAVHLIAVAGLAAATAGTLGTGLEIGGIGGDDASIAYKALVMLEPDHAIDPGWSVSVFKWRIPLTHAFYYGPGTIYAIAPFVAAIADRAKAVRWFTVFCAMLLVAAAYGLAFVVSGSVLCALLCGLNVASSPYLLTQIKHGFVQTGISDTPLSCAGLIFLILACRKRSRSAWLLSCAATGLSLGFAVQSAAPFVAWGLSVLLLREPLRPLWSSRRRWVLWCSLALLGSGLAPMLLANALYGWFSFNGILRNIGVTEFGADNALYGRNLLLRFSNLRYLLGGGPYYPGSIRPSLYFAVLLVLGFARSILDALREGWTNGAPRLEFLPTIYILVVIFLSPFTLFHFDPYHLVIVLPLGWAMIAAASNGAGPFGPRRIAVALGLTAGLVVQGGQWVRFERSADARVEFTRRRNGKQVVQLAQWLLEQPEGNVSLCTSLGSHEFRYLLAGKRTIHEYFDHEFEPLDRKIPDLEEAVRLGTTGYIVSERFRGQPPRVMAALKKLAAKYGVEWTLLKEFKRPGGQIGYEVYALRGPRVLKS